MPLDLRSLGQYRPLHANLSRRPHRRIPPRRRSSRRTCQQSRWYACANPDLPMFGALSGIVHVDGRGKRLGHYLLPAGDTISEPVFVERSADAAEGDGWLLAVVWRARENRSDLAVFNAQDVEAARPRWSISATACRMDSTAIGSGRSSGAPSPTQAKSSTVAPGAGFGRDRARDSGTSRPLQRPAQSRGECALRPARRGSRPPIKNYCSRRPEIDGGGGNAFGFGWVHGNDPPE